MSPEELKTLLNEIEKEKIEINNNINRGIKGLTELMIPLFIAQGDAYKDYIIGKTSYEEEFSKLKKEKEEELSKKEGYKITDSELERYAKGLLMTQLKDYRVSEADYQQLTSYINGYVNHINGIKFDVKEMVRMNNDFNTLSK